MKQSDDRLIQAVAHLKPVTPDAEWEERLRARCHAEIAGRASGQTSRRIKLVDVAAIAALCAYLSAALHEAARLGGLR